MTDPTMKKFSGAEIAANLRRYADMFERGEPVGMVFGVAWIAPGTEQVMTESSAFGVDSTLYMQLLNNMRLVHDEHMGISTFGGERDVSQPLN